MSDLVKGLLIGAGFGLLTAGVFIPLGEKKESIFEKITKKEG